MAVFKSLSGYYVKERPKPHRLEGMTTRQHAGFVLARLPKDYPITPQQKKVRDAAHSCGIKPGISRSALVNILLRLMRVISFEKLLKFGGSLKKWLYRAKPEIESGKCVENRWGASTLMDDGMFQSAAN